MIDKALKLLNKEAVISANIEETKSNIKKKQMCLFIRYLMIDAGNSWKSNQLDMSFNVEHIHQTSKDWNERLIQNLVFSVIYYLLISLLPCKKKSPGCHCVEKIKFKCQKTNKKEGNFCAAFPDLSWVVLHPF